MNQDVYNLCADVKYNNGQKLWEGDMYYEKNLKLQVHTYRTLFLPFWRGQYWAVAH